MQFKYLFSKNYLVKIKIFLLLSVLFSVPLYSQIEIKETVKINPDEKKGLLSKGLSGYEELSVMVIAEADHWKAVVTGPNGVGGMYESDKNGLTGFVHIANPPAGKYNVLLTQYFNESGGNAHISYIASYTGNPYFYKTGDAGQYADGPDSRTTELQFDLEYDNDFYVNFAQSICGDNMVPIPVAQPFCKPNSLLTQVITKTPLTVSISEGGADLVLCDATHIWGKSLTIDSGGGNWLQLKLNSPYYGPAYNALITYEWNGIVHTQEVPVNPSSKAYTLSLLLPDDYYQDALSQHMVHGMVKEFTLQSNRVDECSFPVPESAVKYNVSIAEGSRFGRVKDIKSGRTGTNLQGLNHTEGFLFLQFIADGEIPETEERVVIRVSSDDPDISPLDIEYYIHPNDIKVAFSPPSIKQNDTSDVVLKYKDTDGSWKDFPEYNSFTFSLQRGREYGNLAYKYRNQWWMGELKNLDGSLPVKFTPVENMPVPSAETEMLVSTWKDGQQIYGFGTVSIGENGCSSAPKCNTVPVPPKIGLKVNKSGFDGIDVCKIRPKAAGYFIPVENKYLSDFELDVCYNETADNWQFKVVGDTLYFNVIKDMCDENIFNLHIKPIKSLSELNTFDSVQAKRAYEDFKIQKETVSDSIYLIYEAALAHEEVHKSNYLSKVKDSYDFYKNEFLRIKLKCDEKSNDINKARIIGMEKYKEIMLQYKLEVKIVWKDVIGEYGSERSKVYEKQTQQQPEVQKIVDSYIKYLKRLNKFL